MLKFDHNINFLESGEKITTGFKDFDEYLENINPQNCIITIGGRPSMGKTSFALSICNHLLKNKHKVLYVSLDYTKE